MNDVKIKGPADIDRMNRMYRLLEIAEKIAINTLNSDPNMTLAEIREMTNSAIEKALIIATTLEKFEKEFLAKE